MVAAGVRRAALQPFQVFDAHKRRQRSMSIEEAVVEKLRALPRQRQQEVLEFVVALEQRGETKQPRRSVKGLWADLNVTITEEDIAKARREMWGNFPRGMVERDPEKNRKLFELRALVLNSHMVGMFTDLGDLERQVEQALRGLMGSGISTGAS